MDDGKDKHSIRELAVAVAGNIADTDAAAALVVVQGDGTVRVTPFGAGIAGTIQVLSLGASMLAAKLKVLPFVPTPQPTKEGDWQVIAQEGETCDVPAGTLIRYGADGRFVTKVVDGPTTCTNDVFGDPFFGVSKACSILARGSLAKADDTPVEHKTAE